MASNLKAKNAGLNAELRRFYEESEVGLSDCYSECDGCGILLPSGMDKVSTKFFNLATSGQNGPLWRNFSDAVISILGEQHFNLSGARIRDVGALADYVSEWVLSDCTRCGGRFCIGCRSGPRKDAVCNQCSSASAEERQDAPAKRVARIVATLIHKQVEDGFTTYYIHPRVIAMFEETQGLEWSSRIAVELLRTQNEFEPDFVTDAMADDQDNWSDVTSTIFRGQPMSVVRHRPSPEIVEVPENQPPLQRNDNQTSDHQPSDTQQSNVQRGDLQLNDAQLNDESDFPDGDETHLPEDRVIDEAVTSETETISAELEEQGWVKCSLCNTLVKTKNLSRHENKCRDRHGVGGDGKKSGVTARKSSSRENAKKNSDSEAVPHVGAYISMLFTAVFLGMVWFEYLIEPGFGSKVLLTIASPCVAIGLTILFMIPLATISVLVKANHKKRGVDDSKYERHDKSIRFSGWAIAILCLLPLAISFLSRVAGYNRPNPASAVAPAEVQSDSGATDQFTPTSDPATADTVPQDNPTKTRVPLSDREQLSKDLQETRAKLAELKRRRSNLSGPGATAVDSAIKSMEESVDALEKLLE